MSISAAEVVVGIWDGANPPNRERQQKCQQECLPTRTCPWSMEHAGRRAGRNVRQRPHRRYSVQKFEDDQTAGRLGGVSVRGKYRSWAERRGKFRAWQKNE